jgi:hypothetical protein
VEVLDGIFWNVTHCELAKKKEEEKKKRGDGPFYNFGVKEKKK